MYRTNVTINLSVEGIHAWPGIPEELNEVGFLKFPHRHTFTIKAKKSVTHDDRDLEIILLKRKVSKYLREQYFSTDAQCLMFGSMSCEMIAKELVQVFGLEYCEVLEDGENGAEVFRELPNFKDVVTISGWPCSGKDTFIKAHLPGYHEIVVSDIVRELSEANTTQELAQTKDLGDILAIELRYAVTKALKEGKKVVVNGIRQVEVLEGLKDLDKSDIWLDVSYEVRDVRYVLRGRSSDDLSYDELIGLQMELGVEELEHTLRNDSRTMIIEN